MEAVSGRLGAGGPLQAKINGLQGMNVPSLFIVYPELAWDGLGDGNWSEARWGATAEPFTPDETDFEKLNDNGLGLFDAAVNYTGIAPASSACVITVPLCPTCFFRGSQFPSGHRCLTV